MIARPYQNESASSGDSPTALARERMQNMAHTGSEQKNPALLYRLVVAGSVVEIDASTSLRPGGAQPHAVHRASRDALDTLHWGQGCIRMSFAKLR